MISKRQRFQVEKLKKLHKAAIAAHIEKVAADFSWLTFTGKFSLREEPVFITPWPLALGVGPIAASVFCKTCVVEQGKTSRLGALFSEDTLYCSVCIETSVISGSLSIRPAAVNRPNAVAQIEKWLGDAYEPLERLMVAHELCDELETVRSIVRESSVAKSNFNDVG